MLLGTIPCSICGEYPIMQGGIESHCARLVCPNYKHNNHGDLGTRELKIGFTNWNNCFWTKEQAEKSIKELVLEWNKIHKK